MKKKIALLGSTGSIGTQALEVIREQPDLFTVEVLTAHNNALLLIEQAKYFRPNIVVIANEDLYRQVMDALSPLDIQVYAGEESIEQVVESDNLDWVLNALVGFAALRPTLRALEYSRPLAMANKETFVVAGELVTRKAREKKVPILPVDSEHSAIFQCLNGEIHNPVEKIYLTASGGPFRDHSVEELKKVTKTEALKHPNWDMGCKITIDSASLMNKGLEVIEAHWLFDLRPDQIEVIVHPQSIIHSMVQFEDSSIKAQMGLPDMKLPIQYALGYPGRIKNAFKRFDFNQFPNLAFEQPRRDVFRNLDLAYYALSRGGNTPCILNAANEVVVNAFLRDDIGFLKMSDIIEKAMQRIEYIKHPSFDDLLETNRETRERTKDWVQSLTKSIFKE